MEIYVKIYFISILIFFLVFKHYFIKCVDFIPVSQLQTQQVMSSQIRSHIEYLKQTYYILLLIL